MKKLFIAGNWKSNKTVAETSDWVQAFTKFVSDINGVFTTVPVVVCAPFTVLSDFKKQIAATGSEIHIGAQNVSKFDEGAYTGEVTAKMIHEVADWVIIGHSERRKYFNETIEDLALKVEKAKQAGLHSIFCVPDDATPVPAGVDVVAYEPVWAIGTGKTDTPENANSVTTSIKKKSGVATVIYGGSVTWENVGLFVKQINIDGVLPGGASMDPEKYSRLIHAALSALQ